MTLPKSTTLFTLICFSTATALTGCQPNDTTETVEKAEETSQYSELDNDAPDHHEEHSEHHEDHSEHHEDHADHSDHYEDEGHEGEGHKDVAHADEHDHDHNHNHDKIYTAFNCTPDLSLSVYNHADIQPKTAHLLIDGIEYDLTQTNSSPDDVHSGDVYISSVGLDDNHGLLWEVNDNNATLYEIPVTQAKADTHQEIESLQNKKSLYQCQPATVA